MLNVIHRTLTLQLHELIHELKRDGVVKRTLYAEVPPRVKYELTAIGISMAPIIQSIYDWEGIIKRKQNHRRGNENLIDYS